MNQETMERPKMSLLNRALVGAGLATVAISSIAAGEASAHHGDVVMDYECAGEGNEGVVNYIGMANHNYLGSVVTKVNGAVYNTTSNVEGDFTVGLDLPAGEHLIEGVWVVDYNYNGKSDDGEKFGFKEMVEVDECPAPTTTTIPAPETSAPTTTVAAPETSAPTTTVVTPETTAPAPESTVPVVTTPTETLPATGNETVRNSLIAAGVLALGAAARRIARRTVRA